MVIFTFTLKVSGVRMETDRFDVPFILGYLSLPGSGFRGSGLSIRLSIYQKPEVTSQMMEVMDSVFAGVSVIVQDLRIY
jgi:hypothetical protein